MQNRNEFIQVSKFLLNNLIHSSSSGRSCGLWLMYWARQKAHSWSHLHLIYDCQKTAHQPFPGEGHTEAAFILVNATTETANGYSRQGKPQTRMLAAENTSRIREDQRPLTVLVTFQCGAGKRLFRCGKGRAGLEGGKQTNKQKPTGIKPGVPADTVKKINQLMK